MSASASIILWSCASGLLFGLFVDAVLVGLWTLVATAAPSAARRTVSRPVSLVGIGLLVGIPIAASLLGYFEGVLKAR